MPRFSSPLIQRGQCRAGWCSSAIGAIALLVVIMTWLNNRSLEPDAAEAPAPEVAATAPAQETPPAAPQPAPRPGQPASGPVVLTATEPDWIQVTMAAEPCSPASWPQGKPLRFRRMTAPLLKAGKPEALRVTVGSATAPPVGSRAACVQREPCSRGPNARRNGGFAPPPSAPPAFRTQPAEISLRAWLRRLFPIGFPAGRER